MNDIDTISLADSLATEVGSKHAGLVMRLLEREPDLVLAWLRHKGRLIPTDLQYIPGQSGVRTARNSDTRTFPASAVPASPQTNPHDRLWRVR